MSAPSFKLINLILAMIVCLPVWHSHCTRARFPVLMSCNAELAVHSCPLLCLQRQVTKRESGLFYCWPLLRNNNMATNPQSLTSSYRSRSFAACVCWPQRIHLGGKFSEIVTAASLQCSNQGCRDARNPTNVCAARVCLRDRLQKHKQLIFQYQFSEKFYAYVNAYAQYKAESEKKVQPAHISPYTVNQWLMGRPSQGGLSDF